METKLNYDAARPEYSGICLRLMRGFLLSPPGDRQHAQGGGALRPDARRGDERVRLADEHDHHLRRILPTLRLPETKVPAQRQR